MTLDSNPGSVIFPTKACHNCRRRRRRCDRSQPYCYRCSRDGEECLGYGRVLRWVDPPTASQIQPPSPKHGSPGDGNHETTRIPPIPMGCWSGNLDRAILIRPSLVDPLLNDLNCNSRYYIHHFSTIVCRDLVSIDQNDRNPFRSLVLLVDKYDYLKAIVLATSAMHLAVLYRHQGISSRGTLVDALSSKARAIGLLRAALNQVPLVNKEVLLAAIVFFINLDLIDSGRGGWKSHIQAAGSLISSFQTADHQLDWSLAPMADAIAADCLTYRILGETISAYEPRPVVVSLSDETINVFSVLRRNEAHSYHCSPPFVLQTILSASPMFDPDFSVSDQQTRYTTALSLLLQVRAFDIEEWVYGIRGLSPEDDLPTRVHLASAHRAACCLYIVLAVSNSNEGIPGTPGTRPDDLALEIFNSLCFIPLDHILLKGVVWPTFMAGAQADDPVLRAWYLERLHAILSLNVWICPWGYVRTAIEMLDEIWARRDKVSREEQKVNWLQELKGVTSGCLIV